MWAALLQSVQLFVHLCQSQVYIIELSLDALVLHMVPIKLALIVEPLLLSDNRRELTAKQGSEGEMRQEEMDVCQERQHCCVVRKVLLCCAISVIRFHLLVAPSGPTSCQIYCYFTNNSIGDLKSKF